MKERRGRGKREGRRKECCNTVRVQGIGAIRIPSGVSRLNWGGRDDLRMKHLQALIFSFSLYFLELMKEVGQYLQKYQIDSDDDNITYHPLLCSSFYQNSLKKLFDVFYSPPFTTVPSPVPLLLFSHEVTPTRPPPPPPTTPPEQGTQ